MSNENATKSNLNVNSLKRNEIGIKEILSQNVNSESNNSNNMCGMHKPKYDNEKNVVDDDEPPLKRARIMKTKAASNININADDSQMGALKDSELHKNTKANLNVNVSSNSLNSNICNSSSNSISDGKTNGKNTLSRKLETDIEMDKLESSDHDSDCDDYGQKPDRKEQKLSNAHRNKNTNKTKNSTTVSNNNKEKNKDNENQKATTNANMYQRSNFITFGNSDDVKCKDESNDGNKSDKKSVFAMENLINYVCSRNIGSDLSINRKKTKARGDDINMDGNSNDSDKNNNDEDNDRKNGDSKEKTAYDEGYENIEHIYNVNKHLNGWQLKFVYNLFYSCFEYKCPNKTHRKEVPIIHDEKSWRIVSKKGKENEHVIVEQRVQTLENMLSTVDMLENEVLIKAWKNEMNNLIDNDKVDEAQEFLEVMLLAVEKFLCRLAVQENGVHVGNRSWDAFFIMGRLCACLEYHKKDKLNDNLPDYINCMFMFMCLLNFHVHD